MSKPPPVLLAAPALDHRLQQGLPREGRHRSDWLAVVAAWVANHRVAPARRRWGLCLGLGMGLLFGISQQFRGAHFLSHDVWTAAICWFAALALHVAMFPRLTNRASGFQTGPNAQGESAASGDPLARLG